MLVLLIIFMVAAPLATVDTAVNPPSSNARPQQRPNKPIYLTLKSDLSLAIGDNPAALDAATNGDEEERIFLRADRSVPYGDVMQADERAARGPLSEGKAGRAGNARGFNDRDLRNACSHLFAVHNRATGGRSSIRFLNAV